MLKNATPLQSETFEALRHIFFRAGVQFMLVGGAACREHGLTRAAKDLDLVLQPYPEALVALKASRRFGERLGNEDWTGRTSTYFDARTNVIIDFLTAGIRINNGRLTGSSVTDPLAIPYPVGEVAKAEILVGMKLSAVISGEALIKSHIPGGRPQRDIGQDLADVCGLISMCNLVRDLRLAHALVEQRYKELWDEITTNKDAESKSYT